MKKIIKSKISIFLFLFVFPTMIFAQESNPIITVLDFKTSGVAESDMQLIVSMLSTELFNTGKYTVIDASQRDVILAEMAFSLSGCADESCQLEVGKMLSADMIVVGSIGKAGSRLILDAKILRTETGETVYTADGKYIETDELVDDLPLIAQKLTGDVDIGVVPVNVKMSPRDITGWSLAGGGAVIGTVGGIMMANAGGFKTETLDPSYLAYQDAFYGDDFDALRTAYLDNMDSYKLRSISGTTLVGIGVGSLIAGVILLVLPEAEETGIEVEAKASTLSFRIVY